MKGNSLQIALAVALAFAVKAWATNTVVISEFMALNNTTLADEDGTYADWIEIYNSSPNTVNLAGWYLTGNPANLTRWQFPATNLGPRQFLVVFASDKNRRIAGAPLHTDFKLSASGDYLALVMPDGVTKASEFAPVFPQQYADVSYGKAMTGSIATLIAPDAAARAFVPGADIVTNWRLPAFDDSGWSSGTLGMGFDASGNYAPAIGLDLQSAMLNVNASAYLRVPFLVSDPAAFHQLTLRLRYDDGLVACLNGIEVLHRNAPLSPAWNSAATAAHGAPEPGALNESFEGSTAGFTLDQYAAGPAPVVQPADANSTGQFLRLLHDGANGSGNAVAFHQTAAGLFQRIEAEFDFRITSAVNNPADGFCFLLIPTADYGTSGSGVITTSRAAEEPNYPGTFGIGFDVYPHNQRNDVSAHWNGTEVANVTIPRVMLDLAAGEFHRAKIALEHVAGGALVTVTLTRDINGTAGAPFSPITDFFIAGLNAFDCRVQFGARTGGQNLRLDLDNCHVQFLPPPGPVGFEDFDISTFLSALMPGPNVLAIQGLNVSSFSSNFLIQPWLLSRNLEMTEQTIYLYPPTPGRWNDCARASVLPPNVTFSPAPGVYSSNVLAVALSCSSSSAIIRYTLDGSTPGPESPVYTNVIQIPTNATIRAWSESDGVPSAVTAASYILLDSSVTNLSSNLPLVIIDTLGQVIPDGNKVAAYAVFVDTNTLTGRTTLSSSNDYLGRLGVGLHGSSSLGFPKKTYSVELKNEGGKAADYPLLGLPAGSDWLLYPSYNDKTFLNNVLTHELFAAMGHYAIRCKYTEVFLRTTPGKLSASDYQGIYVLMERIRVNEERLDIATLAPTDAVPPEVTGGYLFAKDKMEADDLIITTSSGQPLVLRYPNQDQVAPAQLNYLTSYLNAFETALYGANWRDPLAGYAAFIDVDSFVDFHWVVEYAKNIDGVRISNYMHKDRNGKITAGPIWDWDLSWGNADYLEGGKTNGWYYPLMSAGDDLWLRKLRTDPDFYQKIIDRWGALRSNLFNPANIFARTDQITNLLWEAQARDFAAWPRLGRYVWPNPNGAAGGWDVDYVSPTTYAGILQQFKRYVQGRYLWIDRQFVPTPILLTNGSTLTLSAPLGSVYFTLDGTDPRASGGGFAASARLYAGAVTLTNNAGIFARALYTNSWSAPARAVFVASLPPLRITEINYHPVNPPTNSPYNDEDFEFIELQNTSTNAINLAGMRLGGGVDFTFALNQLALAGSVTSNSFDGGGTPMTASTLGSPPAAYFTNDGPAGDLLRLLNSGTNASRNRAAFHQTATGSYDRTTAEFAFRARVQSPPATNGSPTRQDFDVAGATYTLTHTGPTAPSVRPADAGSTSNYLRLVPASGSELGTIAFNRTAIGAFNSVVATFDFRITPPSEANQADGMSFALLSTAAYGSTGAGPAFGEGANLANSIGVSFDVHNNGSTPAEPNNNHISLHWNNAQVGNAVTPLFDLSNGKFHRAQLLLWFEGGNAYVTLRLTPDINGVRGAAETVLQSALIPGVAPYQSRVAFSARTGGAWAAHDLDNVNVEFSSHATAASGLSLLLLPVAQFGDTGPGTTLAAFTNLPLVANALALDLAFNASNLVNDVSLYWNGAHVGTASLPVTNLDLDAGMFHYARLQLDATAGGVYANVSIVPQSLGSTGVALNVFTNWFVPNAVLANNRLELAARNGGLSAKLDLENVFGKFEVLSPVLLNPGEYIVVVKSLAAFTSRYGTGIRVAGEYSGSLNNAGERLTLLGPVGEPILDFKYDPAWYPVTDGAGYSLVMVDPFAPTSSWGLAQQWRPSNGPGGSPGNADPFGPVTLTITRISDETVTLAWPASAGGAELYSAHALTLAGPWLRVDQSPVLSNDLWIVTVNPLTNGASFYRLQSPASSGP